MSTTTLQISLDGGVTYVTVNHLRVIVSSDRYPNPDDTLHFNFTDEGLIVDARDVAGNVAGTDADMYDDLYAYLTHPEW